MHLQNTMLAHHFMKPQLAGVISARDTISLIRYAKLDDGSYEAISGLLSEL